MVYPGPKGAVQEQIKKETKFQGFDCSEESGEAKDEVAGRPRL
jgi:hypothetical protein